MAVVNMRAFASVLANYARINLENVQRAAMLVRLDKQGTFLGAVFGNDNFAANCQTRREVELLRRQLTDVGMEELALGTSDDGYTWALLVKTDNQEMQTAAGKAFRAEMLKAYLNDAVWAAWQTACTTDEAESSSASLTEKAAD
jgi:hypothetical protein